MDLNGMIHFVGLFGALGFATLGVGIVGLWLLECMQRSLVRLAERRLAVQRLLQVARPPDQVTTEIFVCPRTRRPEAPQECCQTPSPTPWEPSASDVLRKVEK
jgi:hypothetical protein